MAINPGEPTPLELVSADELIDELKSRSLALVLVRIVRADNGNGTARDSNILTDYEGGFSTNLGMIHLAEKQLERRFFGMDKRGDE